jgi:hypothetical protein
MLDRRHFVGVFAGLVFGVGPGELLPQQTGQSVVVDGTLEIIVEDQKERSRILYFLVVDQQRIPLRFQARPSQLTTGMKVRIRGVWQPDHALLVSRIDRL